MWTCVREVAVQRPDDGHRVLQLALEIQQRQVAVAVELLLGLLAALRDGEIDVDTPRQPRRFPQAAAQRIV